jgi:septal ring factor EnvC (AmiA/AmiB activator)
MGNSNVPKGIELADVSPKMEETQNFYVATIQNEIAEINTKRTASNQKIIDDAFKQLEILEADYRKLTFELKESNADKRVIYAMITNFQNRLYVLQNLMEQLEEFEKMAPYENKV